MKISSRIQAARSFFQHGFAIPEEKPTEQELKIFQGLAAGSGHFAFPMLLFAEGLRPLAFLISSLLTGLEPIGELFVAPSLYQKFLSLFGKRGNLDAFSSLLEKEVCRDEPKKSF